MAKKIVLILLVFGVVSCQFKKDGADEADEVREPKAFKPSTLKFEVEPESKFGFYSIRLKWSDLEGCSPVIQRRIEGVAATESVNLNLGDTSHEDRDIPHSSQFIYNLLCVENGSLHAIESATVKVPVDWLVQDDVVLSKGNLESGATHFSPSEKGDFLGVFGRLMIMDGVSILVEDSKITIQGQTAIFRPNSSIGTFRKNQMAAAGNMGRRGGTISLDFKNGEGTLHLSLIGEQGGEGLAGDAYSKEELPVFPRASNGRKAFYKEERISAKCGREAECSHLDTVAMRCHQPPTDGAKGMAGARGKTGNRGLGGGSTGTANIKFISAQPEIKLLRIEGLPGVGGRGGPGSPGGPGGFAGENPNPTICRSAKDGASGDDGPVGPQGPEGSHGPIEVIRVWNPTRGEWEIR